MTACDQGTCRNRPRFLIHVNVHTSEAMLVQAMFDGGDFCKRCGKAEIKRRVGATTTMTGFGSPMHIPPIWTKE